MTGASAASGCAPTSDLLPELALGILGGSERAEVLAHLDTCATCRAKSEEWAETADVLPTLLPEAEPPAGFEARTLERLRFEQTRVPRWSLTRRVLSVAAIVAAAMIVTLATVRILDADNSSSPTASGSSNVTSARMVGANGGAAGDVFMTAGNESYVFMDVDYGARSGTYRVEATDAANQVTKLGSMSITNGRGVWAGEAKGETPTTVRLVDSEGQVWCTARFGPVAT
jgi:anti-sigma-K factor RskA